MAAERPPTRWEHDALAFEVAPTSSRVGLAGVLVALAAFAGVVGLRLGQPAAMICLIPALWAMRALSSPTRVVVGYAGVRVGRTWIPRDQILSASPGGRFARLALLDGRIVHVPMPGPAELEAVVSALARPAALFESSRARSELSPVRDRE